MSGEDPMPFDQAVWQVYSKGGRKAVRQGFEPEHISGYSDKFLIQMLRLPSFTSEIGWQIYQRNPVIYRRHPIENDGEPRFVGCRTEWLKEEDIQRFSSPVRSLQYLNRLAPTMRFQTVELDPQWTQQQTASLLSVSVPPFAVSNSIGLDGVSYEVRQGSYMAGTCLNWWCEGPDEWQPLTKIVLAILEELEDIYAFDAAQVPGDQAVPFDQATAETRTMP